MSLIKKRDYFVKPNLQSSYVSNGGLLSSTLKFRYGCLTLQKEKRDYFVKTKLAKQFCI